MSPEEFVMRGLAGRFVYHFTDERNLQSISSTGGLWSLKDLRQRGIKAPAPGGNQWSHEADENIGLDGYVHLCATEQHPMEYRARQDGRLERVRYLKIAPTILLQDGILITLDVSNKAGVPTYTLADALNLMDIDALVTRMNWRDPAQLERVKAVRKYEVLVPHGVNAQLISNLNG